MMTVFVAVVLDDQTLHLDPVRLVWAREQSPPSWFRDAVVPDQWIGEYEDLTRIGRIRQRLHVTGHSGVEDYLSTDRSRRAEAISLENRPVIEQESRGTHVETLGREDSWGDCKPRR